jgi:MinD-like ATPase involved in chromosome partitioning or flagellar assembly
MSELNLLQQIEEQMLHMLSIVDPNVKVLVKRDAFGWFRLSVITTIFEKMGFESREHQIDTILASLNLKLDEYPFADYQLLTPQEASEQVQRPPIQLPLWSEILMAPDPEESVPVDENKLEPFVVTFYSFKGGVGRSTALAFVANILATSGYRVVMIDFDLEAPGLSLAQTNEISAPNTFGVLDYLYQRYLVPEENKPSINECVRQISISDRGELYLVPAGAYDERYIHLLADLNVRSLYQSDVNPIHQLLQDVKESLKPDVILIDAGTGFTEMGAVALFDQADLGIICFSPTRESFAGLEWVVKTANRQRKYYGIPDLRFLLTPMPSVAHIQHEKWLSQAADWIDRHWKASLSLTVDEIYYHVPYDPNILALDSLFVEVPENILKSYEPLANTISACLPDKER